MTYAIFIRRANQWVKWADFTSVASAQTEICYLRDMLGVECHVFAKKMA